MNRFLAAFLALSLAAVACSLPETERSFSTPTPRIQASPTEMVIEEVIIIPTDTPTALVPTPTVPDYRATDISAGATHDASIVSAAQAQADSDKAKAVSDSIISTKEAENRTSSDEMNQLRGRITFLKSTITAEAQEYSKALPTIQAAQTLVGYTAQREVAYISFIWVLVGFLAILALIALVGSFRRAPKAFEETNEPRNIPHLTDPIQQPIRTAQQKPDQDAHVFNVSSGSPEYPTVFQHALLKSIATDEQIEWLANGLMRDGKKLSYADWTPEWKNGFSDSKFSQLMRFLIDAGLASYNDPANTRLGARVNESSFVREFRRYRTDGPSGPPEKTTPPPTEAEPMPDTEIQPVES